MTEKIARFLCWPFKPTPFRVKFFIITDILLLIILVTVWLFAFEKISQNHRFQAAHNAIFSVLEQKASAEANATVILNPQSKKPIKTFAWARYIPAIGKIDYSKCPKDFQLAWLEYLQSWEAYQLTIRSEHPLLSLAELAKFDASGAKHDSEKVQDALLVKQQAWFNCQRVAVRYGFFFTNSP